MTEPPSFGHLTLLGHHAVQPVNPSDAILERVSNPATGKHYIVRLTCPEFTSLCPVTGQADFFQIESCVLESCSIVTGLEYVAKAAGIQINQKSDY